jgi:hypothetical protein
MMFVSDEPTVDFAAAGEEADIVASFPTVAITGAGSTLESTSCYGVLYVNRPPLSAINKAILNLALIEAGVVDLLGNPNLIDLGTTAPSQGLVQLALTDLALVDPAPVAEASSLSSALDCVVFTLHAVIFNPAEFIGSSRGGLVPVGFPPDTVPGVRMQQLPLMVAIPGGWHQVGKFFSETSSDPLSVTAPPTSSNAMLLKNSELSTYELESVVATLPAGTSALLLRGWNHFAYGTPPTMTMRLSTRVW